MARKWIINNKIIGDEETYFLLSLFIYVFWETSRVLRNSPY
ncbi:hypothetical protein CMALT394_40060 [Carnobacterium maltaromaticum]|nr:hypothetical protein CMALT394_40060 [Carnobacterium maltaromaticum]